MSGAKSRRKGAVWEREVSSILTTLTGVGCARRLRQYQIGGSDIETELPIAVECKTGYRINASKALQQVQDAAEMGELPFVWVKQNKKGGSPSRYVIVHEDDFLPILLDYLRGWVQGRVHAMNIFDSADQPD
tara:strand:- start:1891 stop:2286 length:396 start_codon:yes stop_codon:yes gene_type:complete